LRISTLRKSHSAFKFYNNPNNEKLYIGFNNFALLARLLFETGYTAATISQEFPGLIGKIFQGGVCQFLNHDPCPFSLAKLEFSQDLGSGVEKPLPPEIELFLQRTLVTNAPCRLMRIWLDK